MKLGPIEIRMAKSTPPLGELGATGTQIFGGILGQQDYNDKLQGPQSYDEYDKMRNDGQVRAALMALKLPLLNADWFVEPASDRAADREIAERLEHNLKEGMTTSWRETLRQTLLHLDYGSIPFEKVWEMRSAQGAPWVALRKLAPRLPKTIQQWLTDESGGLKAIKQYTSTASGFKVVDIPVGKLLVFVNDLEGSNWRGCSVLRPAWKHYFYKDGLYRVQAIALEKRSLGVDVGTLKGDAINEDSKKDLEKALMSLHAHEKQFFVEAEGQYGYRLEGVGRGGVLDPKEAIEHHDLRILRSILAEFIGMGEGSTGSLAMHRDKSAFFLMALGGKANYVADTFSAHLIRPWVDYNWSVEEYPRLRYSRLESRDVKTLAEAVAKFVEASALTPDEGIEKEVRSLLDLPAPAPGGTNRRNGNEKVVGARTMERQIEKLLEVGEAMFRRGDVGAVGGVSVPYRSELVEELTVADREIGLARAEASLAGTRMKTAFVEEMIGQFRRQRFDRVRLTRALGVAAGVEKGVNNDG